MQKNKLTVEELLFNDEPIVVNRKLAKCLGINEAVVFQQIHYWLQINKKKNNNYRDGKYWTYNSMKKWHEEEFDFIAPRTLERIFKRLEKSGLIETAVFNKMEGDKTKWYTINYDMLLEVCEKKLTEKEILSEKRRIAGKLGAKSRLESEENTTYNDTMLPNWQDGNPCCQNGEMVLPNWQNGIAKLAEPIPETSTKTSTEISLEVSSSSITLASEQEKISSLIAKASANIQPLEKGQIEIVKSYIEKYGIEFVEALVDYSIVRRAKTFSYFVRVIEKAIDGNNITVELFKKSVDEFSTKKETKKKTKQVLPTVEGIELTGKDMNELKDTIKDMDGITPISFRTWFTSVELRMNDGKLTVGCPNVEHMNYVKNKYHITIAKAAMKKNITPEIAYVVYKAQK